MKFKQCMLGLNEFESEDRVAGFMLRSAERELQYQYADEPGRKITSQDKNEALHRWLGQGRYEQQEDGSLKYIDNHSMSYKNELVV